MESIYVLRKWKFYHQRFSQELNVFLHYEHVGKPHSNQTPKTAPCPQVIQPHLTHHSLAQLYSLPQMLLDRFTHFHTTMPYWLQLASPYLPPILPLTIGRSPPLSILHILGPSWPTTKNGIRFLPQFTEQTDQPLTYIIITDRKRSSAIAEGPRDAILSRNSAATKHPF